MRIIPKILVSLLTATAVSAFANPLQKTECIAPAKPEAALI